MNAIVHHALSLTAAGAASLAFLWGCQPAKAHDAWSNGEEVPAWVKTACCSKAHAHRVVEEAVHEMGDGVHVDGYEYTIPYAKVLPSPDGSTWLFFSANADGSQNPPYCFFRGVKGS